MSEFRIKTEIPRLDVALNHKTVVGCVGSCFAQEIGTRMREGGFEVGVNPHGILFNPISILHYFQMLSGVRTARMLKSEKGWLSLDHHGMLASDSEAELSEKITVLNNVANGIFARTDVFLITLGTAHVWQWNDDSTVVANCHKIPANHFTRRLASIEEIVKALQDCMDLFPTARFVFTVSPIRYTRDTLVGSNRSKARLLEAVHTVVESSSKAFYFPAYEIVVDELRDYRFYKDDMVHPTDLAVEYVYQQFLSSVGDTQTLGVASDIRRLSRAMHHRGLTSLTSAAEAQEKAKLEIARKIEEERSKR
ncbi:MAG: GSCFA domain-containing protein [Flavobacteriales bacterium]|nr:GSCFA domain-containing protein [Flavobacteriales bacterium]